MPAPPLRRSATGRVPRWVVDEAVGRPAVTTAWRTWSAAPPPDDGRPDRQLGGWRSVVRRAVSLAGVAVVGVFGWSQLTATPLPWVGVVGTTASTAPPPGVGSASLPLGVPPATGGTTGSHAFVQVHPDGSPVTYDPCRDLRLVVGPGAPPGADAVLADAVGVVAAASGLRLVVEGPTDERPDAARAPYLPERYGERWAPVLVSWVDEASDPLLADDVVGHAGSVSVAPDGGWRTYVSGSVVLERDALGPALVTPAGEVHVRAVVVHELGHLLGLDHVDDPRELMHPVTGPGTLGLGDRAGLAALGAGTCAPEL